MLRLVLVHRCMNNRAPEYRNELRLNRELGLHRTRGHEKLHLMSVKSEWKRKSFGFKAALDWNRLPEDLRQIGSAVTFKRNLKLYLQNASFTLLTYHLYKSIAYTSHYFYVCIVCLQDSQGDQSL